MKSRASLFGRLLLSAALISFSGSAQALTKANNATALATASSWVENVVPSSTDVLLFNSTGVPSVGGLTVAAFNGTLGGSLQFTDIAGNVNITQSSGNTWTIGPSANTTGYTGGIDMSAATADVTIGSSGRTLRWGSGNYGGISVAANRTLTIGSNFSTAGNTKTIVMTGPGNIIFNGTAGSGGAMGFSIQGGATVTMNGAGSWSGSSLKEVLSGTLNLGIDTALGSAALALGGTGTTATPTLTASGSARTIANNINLLAVTTGSTTITGSNALTANGVLTNSGGNRTLSVNNTALTTFGTGGIALSEGATNRVLTINGSGNVTVSGVIANGSTSAASGLTYSGTGLLSLSNANTFGGTLTATSGTTRIDNTLAAQSATVSVGATNALAFGTGIISATFGGLSGAGDLALTNIDTSSVALSVGNNNANSSYSGALGGTGGSLTKIGTGTLTIGNTAASTYTGGTTISSGQITLSTDLANTDGLGSGAVLLNGGTLKLKSNGPSSTAAGAFDNTIQVDAGQTGTLIGFGRGTLGSTLLGGGTFNYQTDYVRADVSGNWSAFTGQINVTPNTNGGDFRINNTNGFGTARINLATGVSMYMNVNFASTLTNTIGELTGTGTLKGGPSSGRTMTWDVGGANTNAQFDGTIQNGAGSTAITKSGTAIWTLTGANAYTGSTTITGGTLALTGSGSLASPNIIVGASTTFDVSGVTGGFTLASGQTLSGPGTVTGAMTVGGTLSPGNSPGTLATGNQIWSNGGDYNWQILDATGVAGTGYDTIAITGTLDLSTLTAGQFGINLWSLSSIGPDVSGNATNFNNALNQSWTILTTSAGISGFEATDFLISVGANNGTAGFSNALGGGAFSLGQSGNNLVLSYTAVPEPGAALLGGLGLLALLRRRRN